MRRTEHRDERNYSREAQDLIKGLSTKELYRLYEIVITESEGYCTKTRRSELDAVSSAIEGVRHLEESRLKRIRRGLSEMARGAKATDGNTKKYQKKV